MRAGTSGRPERASPVLAAEAKEAGLNLSQVAQDALRRELDRQDAAHWVARVRELPPTGVTHEQVLTALRAVRHEMGQRGE